MKSRRARWLVGLLALVGVGVLLARTEPLLELTTFLMPREQGQLYRLGLRCGTVDGSAGADVSRTLAQDPLGLVFYLRANASDYIQSHPETFTTDKRAQARMVRQTFQLATHIETVGLRQQRQYLRVFLAGYQAGNKVEQLRQSIERKMLE